MGKCQRRAQLIGLAMCSGPCMSSIPLFSRESGTEGRGTMCVDVISLSFDSSAACNTRRGQKLSSVSWAPTAWSSIRPNGEGLGLIGEVLPQWRGRRPTHKLNKFVSSAHTMRSFIGKQILRWGLGGVPPQTKNVVFLLAPSLAQLWGKKSFSVGLGVHGKKRRFFGGLAEVVVFAPMPPGVCGAHKAALKKRLLCGL